MSLPEPATSGRKGTEGDVGSVFVSNYPPFSTWSEDDVADARDALQSPPQPGAEFGLYLHIPFCRKRCRFCYFKVVTGKNAQEVREYVDTVLAELDLLAARAFVGGRHSSAESTVGTAAFHCAVTIMSLIIDMEGDRATTTKSNTNQLNSAHDVHM